MKYLLLLGASQFQRERSIAGAEKAFNGPIVVCSSDTNGQPNNYSRFSISIENETDPTEVLNSVQKFNTQFNATPICVVPLNDFVLESAYLVSNTFNINSNTLETIRAARLKNLMKDKFRDNNIPHSKSYVCNNYEEVQDVAKKINSWPLIIKPVNFGGSGGVVKIESSEKLLECYSTTQEHLSKYAKKYNSIDDQVIIEQFIDFKDEISVEVINTPESRKIIGITKKFLGPEPYFAEIGHLAAEYIIEDDIFKSTIHEVATSVCSAFQINYGIAHVEMKIDIINKKIIVLEVGARPAGDSIIDLWEKAIDINLYSLHCQSYLGILDLSKIDFSIKYTAGIGYFTFPYARIDQISPLKPIISEESLIEKINLRCQVDQLTSPPKDWTTRYGFINYFENSKTLNLKLLKLNELTSKITNKIFKIERL